MHYRRPDRPPTLSVPQSSPPIWRNSTASALATASPRTMRPSKMSSWPPVVQVSDMKPNAALLWGHTCCRPASSVVISTRLNGSVPRSSTNITPRLKPLRPSLFLRQRNRDKNTNPRPRVLAHHWPVCPPQAWQACICAHQPMQTNWSTASAPSLNPRQEQQNENRTSNV